LGNIFTARDQADSSEHVLVATIAETSTHPEETSNSLEIVQLFPLADDIVAAWVQEVQCTRADFDPRSQALEPFRCSGGDIRMHWFDAYKLCKRLTANSHSQVQQAVQELLDRWCLSHCLCCSQPVRYNFECLALDPTDKPQSREYSQVLPC